MQVPVSSRVTCAALLKQAQPRSCAAHARAPATNSIYIHKSLWIDNVPSVVPCCVQVAPRGAERHMSHANHTLNDTHHASKFTCHTSHVTRHMSRVRHVTRHAAPCLLRALVMFFSMDCEQVTRQTSHVTRHTPHVKLHTSHVTRHTSHVTRHTSCIRHHTSHVTRNMHTHLPLTPQSFAFFFALLKLHLHA